MTPTALAWLACNPELPDPEPEVVAEHRGLVDDPADVPVALAAIYVEVDYLLSSDRHLVADTMLMHQLYTLGTDGHTASKKGQATLEQCVKTYLDLELPAPPGFVGSGRLFFTRTSGAMFCQIHSSHDMSQIPPL